MMRGLILILIGLFLLQSSGHAQQYTYTQYNIKEGLSGSMVYCVTSDTSGFLWFGTETGLSRFDGTHFKNFDTRNGLTGVEILQVFGDSKGNVWVVPFEGSICVIRNSRVFSEKNDDLLKKLNLPGTVMGIAEDKFGFIWLMAPNFLAKLNTSQKTVQYYYPSDIGLGAFSTIGISTAGCIQLLCEKGVVSFNDKEEFVVEKHIVAISPHFNMNTLGDGVLVYRNTFFTLDFLFDGFKKNITIPFFMGIQRIGLVAKNLIALNTQKGVILYDENGIGQLRRYLPSESVSNTFKDHEGNLWFTTLGNGVFRLNSEGAKTVVFEEDYGRKAPVMALHGFNDTIYAGTSLNSIYRFKVGYENAYLRTFSRRVDRELSTITSIKVGPDKNIYYGTGMLMIRSDLGGNFIDTIQGMAVKDFAITNDTLFISSSSGITMVNAKDFSDRTWLWHGRTTTLANYNGSLYFGTLHGIYKILPNGIIKDITVDIPILKTRISTIDVDGRGVVWVGTYSMGLFALKDDKIIRHYNVENGISSLVCKSIYISDSAVWLGTDKGLNRIDLFAPTTEIFHIFRSDGLVSDVINGVWVHNTTAYVATPAGLSFFDIKKIGDNSFCRLRWSGVSSNGVNYELKQDLIPTLPNNISNLRFDYIGISYRSNGDITYRYRLMGLDSSWNYTRETYMNYPSLPAGQYKFQVIAKNKYGVSSDVLEWSFEVAKKWWQLTWVIVLEILLFAILMGSIFFLYNNHLQKKSAEQNRINQRIAELEQLALRSQMNPHFIFNSLNSIQQYVMDKDIAGANKFISAFSKLIRQTLDFSSRSQISVQEETEYLRNYLELEKTRLENQFDFTILLSDAVPATSIFIPPMILQPYIENSIRHGVRYRNDGKGLIQLKISIQQKRLVCEIIDNGMGRRYTMANKGNMPIEYQSKGMTLTENRVNILNKVNEEPIEVYIDDAFPNEDTFPGTRVVLQFPL